MSLEWKTVELKSIADVTMGQSPKSEFYNDNFEGMPFLQGNKTFGDKYPSFELYTTSIKKVAKKSSVLMSVRAPVGDLNIAREDICIGRGVCGLQMKRGDNEFLYYLLKANIPQLINKESGTVFGSINKNDIETFEVTLPEDFEDQMKILTILKNIDKKIEISKKLNNNLADCVLAIFRRWFVNFEPFKNNPFIDSDFGFIPENWKVGTIGDYCKIKSGFAFKSAWWQEDGIKVIKIKDINQDSIDLNDCSCVSSDKLEKASEFEVTGGDLIIAMTGATLGKFSIVPKNDEPLYVNQRVGKFFLGGKPSSKLPFIWSLLKQKRISDEIVNRGQGSAQPNVSPTDIETIEIILPPVEIINQFNEECRSMFELMINKSYEITKLNKLRDTLLPKLMSGEIDITKINYDLND